MKLIRISWLLMIASLFVAGCESVTDRFSAVPPRVQVFNGDTFAVNAAALQAFKRLDFGYASAIALVLLALLLAYSMLIVILRQWLLSKD